MFKKWELIKENQERIMERYYPLTYITIIERVIVDIYRKKKFNGIWKYKYVVKETIK